MTSTLIPPELYFPEFDSGWLRYSLYDLATWINGMAFKDINFADFGTPVIKIAEIKNGVSGQTKYTQEKYDQKYFLHDGDMLFCWSGQPETSIDTYWWRGGDGWLNQHIFKVLPNQELVDRSFLYQLLRYVRPTFVQIARNKQTTGLGHVTKADLQRLVVALPPLDVQRGIAATLGALDDKIESNRKLVLIINELISFEFQHLISTESPKYLPLVELTSITKGVSYRSADLKESRTSLVTLKSFDRTGGYKPDGLKPYVGPYKPTQVIAPGEVVVAQTDLTQGAEVIGRAVRVPGDRSADTLVASLDLVIVRPTDGIAGEYLFGILTDDSFRQHCRSRTNGTTVLHLSSDAIPTYMAPVVSAVAQDRFIALSRPLVARADSLEREIVGLSNLRDVLIPELLSGRIRTSETEEAFL